MAKITSRYTLYCVPMNKSTERAAHIFNYSLLSNGVLYFITNKKIKGAVILEKSEQLPDCVRAWLKNSLLDIELKHISNKRSKAGRNIKKVIQAYENELDKKLIESEVR